MTKIYFIEHSPKIKIILSSKNVGGKKGMKIVIEFESHHQIYINLHKYFFLILT